MQPFPSAVLHENQKGRRTYVREYLQMRMHACVNGEAKNSVLSTRTASRLDHRTLRQHPILWPLRYS